MPASEMVSAICPTFGRFPAERSLLQEAVYWFTRQTYPLKELIIVNDAENQHLTCNVPGVIVMNLDKRYSLGAKYNIGISQAIGSILMTWEDDDISLPHRMSQAVSMLDGYDYFNPQRSFFQQNGKILTDHKHGYCHNASAFRRTLWRKVGGYPDISGPQDAVMDGKLKATVLKMPRPLQHPREWSYVYRWGVSSLHLSSRSNTEEAYRNNKAADGRYNIESAMGEDYDSLCNCAADAHGARDRVGR